jgi:hypothetical protein
VKGDYSPIHYKYTTPEASGDHHNLKIRLVFRRLANGETAIFRMDFDMCAIARSEGRGLGAAFRDTHSEDKKGELSMRAKASFSKSVARILN